MLCREFKYKVSGYVEAIVPLLSLTCDSQWDMDRRPPQGAVQCAVCEAAVAYVQAMLLANATSSAIMKQLDKVRPRCGGISEFLEVILKLIPFPPPSVSFTPCPQFCLLLPSPQGEAVVDCAAVPSLPPVRHPTESVLQGDFFFFVVVVVSPLLRSLC